MLVSPLAGFGLLTAGLAVACCLTALVSDSSMFGFGLPGHPRQVNELWLGRYRRWVYAAGFGLQIGTGFATYIMSAAVYLTVALAMLSGSPILAILVGLLFGFMRGSAVLLSGRVRRPADLLRLHERLDRWAPWSLRAAMAVEAGAALTFGAVAFGWAGALVVAAVLLGGAVLGRHRTGNGSNDPALLTPAR
jgi:hypothetical protein